MNASTTPRWYLAFAYSSYSGQSAGADVDRMTSVPLLDGWTSTRRGQQVAVAEFHPSEDLNDVTVHSHDRATVPEFQLHMFPPRR